MGVAEPRARQGACLLPPSAALALEKPAVGAVGGRLTEHGGLAVSPRPGTKPTPQLPAVPVGPSPWKPLAVSSRKALGELLRGRDPRAAGRSPSY